MRQIPFLENPYSVSPQMSSQSPFHEEKEVHLRDYWKVILKRRWIILVCFLIVVIITLVGNFKAQNIYRASTTIQIDREIPNLVDFKDIFAFNWDMDYIQTQCKILESRTLANKVIQTMGLSGHPQFQPIPLPTSDFQQWKSNIRNSVSSFFRSLLFFRKTTTSEKNPTEEITSPSSIESSESKMQNALIDQLLGNLTIEPIKQSRLVKIHFDSPDPGFASQVANTIATSFTKLNLEKRFNATEQAKEWLTQQLEDLRAKVERADEALQDFGANHDLVTLDEKENATMQRFNELNQSLIKAESERMAKEALYKQAGDRNFDSHPLLAENKLVAELRSSYNQLETQYVRLSETYKPGYPEMVRLKAQMETIQKRIRNEIGKAVAGIKNDYELSLRRESMLRAAFEQQKTKVLEMKENAIQFNILKREADTNRELYKSLLQRMKEAGIQAGVTASNIHVIDQAQVPKAPFKPNRQRNLLVAMVVGLLLGGGLAFFFEYLDNTIKTSEDVEQRLQLPSIGLVPEVSYQRRKRLETGKSYPVELITYGHPKSMLSEAYRNIRTSLLLSFSEKPPKKILISSPNPAEGKTTTVVNTAIALAQTGARVVVIDTDLRKPRIHKIFNHGENVGLSNLLSGHEELDSIIKKTEVPDLYYIPSGPIPPNPSELLGSPFFKRVTEILVEKFDHVIFDSPPILGFADSIIISNLVDGIIIVVLAGKTPRETLKRAKEVLLQVNAKILGVVINQVDIHRSEYGYYYYRYHYYYGEKRKKKELPYDSGKKPV